MLKDKLPDLEMMKASNILMIGLDALDYETFIKKLCENNPTAKITDAKKEVPEDEFDKIKEDLMASIALAGLKEICGALGDILKSFAEPNGISDFADAIKTFGTVESPKPPDAEPDNAKHVKLTGQPAIDTEIIFNMIKNHTK